MGIISSKREKVWWSLEEQIRSNENELLKSFVEVSVATRAVENSG